MWRCKESKSFSDVLQLASLHQQHPEYPCKSEGYLQGVYVNAMSWYKRKSSVSSHPLFPILIINYLIHDFVGNTQKKNLNKLNTFFCRRFSLFPLEARKLLFRVEKHATLSARYIHTSRSRLNVESQSVKHSRWVETVFIRGLVERFFFVERETLLFCCVSVLFVLKTFTAMSWNYCNFFHTISHIFFVSFGFFFDSWVLFTWIRLKILVKENRKKSSVRRRNKWQYQTNTWEKSKIMCENCGNRWLEKVERNCNKVSTEKFSV